MDYNLSYTPATKNHRQIILLRHLKTSTQKMYADALYDLYLNGRNPDEITISFIESKIHPLAKSLQTIKRFTEENLKVTSATIKKATDYANKIATALSFIIETPNPSYGLQKHYIFVYFCCKLVLFS